MIIEFDYFLFLWIHSNLENPNMDQLMSWITYSGNKLSIFSYIFIVGLIVGLIYRSNCKRSTTDNHIHPFRIAIRFMLLGSAIFGATAGISQILKETTQRPRPYEVHQVRRTEALNKTTAGEEKESFPSGHAAGAFSIVVILVRRFGKKLRILYVWAIIVALSRVYLGAHYPIDVIVGGCLGWLIANLIISGSLRISKKQFLGFT